ncbi:hypothetical protein HMI56_006422 [Coelomomyces lativittatus]|nr:hypothetical protein HMI56_006422 [Coelomomyces lativittatus]
MEGVCHPLQLEHEMRTTIHLTFIYPLTIGMRPPHLGDEESPNFQRELIIDSKPPCHFGYLKKKKKKKSFKVFIFLFFFTFVHTLKTEVFQISINPIRTCHFRSLRCCFSLDHHLSH